MGELGNTMPLALANILSSPVLLFTSMETMPVLLITPSIMRDAVPRVHLAFNQFGAGHYDAIHIVSRDIEQTCENEISNPVREEADSSPIIRECSCGKNAKRSTQENPFFQSQTRIHRDALVIKIHVVVTMVVRARDVKTLMERKNCYLINSLCYPLARHEKDISILYRQK